MSLEADATSPRDRGLTKRAAQRIKIFEPTTIKSSENPRQRAHLIDISASGALIHSHPGPAKHDIIVVAFGEFDVDATVVWTDVDRFGVRFKRELSADLLERLLR